MGLSNITAGDEPQTTATRQPTVGDYFASRYPVTGGLAQAVFGDNQMASAPLLQMPGQPNQDSSMIAMNAQPKGGGGLEALLKLFAGGA
jgi:hypothetical protein